MGKADYEHELGRAVMMAMTQESGSIIGRAEYQDRPHSYLVRYVTGDGRQVEDWFSASALRVRSA